MKIYTHTKNKELLTPNAWYCQALVKNAEPLWVGLTSDGHWSTPALSKNGAVSSWKELSPAFSVCTLPLQVPKLLEHGEVWINLDTRDLHTTHGDLSISNFRKFLKSYGISLPGLATLSSILNGPVQQLRDYIALWNATIDSFVAGNDNSVTTQAPAEPPLSEMLDSLAKLSKKTSTPVYKWVLSKGVVVRHDTKKEPDDMGVSF